jgi:hypothetical protein
MVSPDRHIRYRGTPQRRLQQPAAQRPMVDLPTAHSFIADELPQCLRHTYSADQSGRGNVFCAGSLLQEKFDVLPLVGSNLLRLRNVVDTVVLWRSLAWSLQPAQVESGRELAVGIPGVFYAQQSEPEWSTVGP